MAIPLSGYSALTFAMRASTPNLVVSVALTNASNRVIGHVKPLSNFGGAPTVGKWKVYKVPVAALVPSGAQAHGFMLMVRSSSTTRALYTLYIDSIQLLSSGDPTATATNSATTTTTTTPTSMPTSTATADPTATTPSGPPLPPGSFVIPGNPENTTGGFHVGLPGMSNISSGSSLMNVNPPVRMVWDWNDGGNASSYPSVFAGVYVPGDRQPDITYNTGYGAQQLSWFLSNHPDWIEYRCDKSSVAYEFGSTTYVPLDVTNPAVQSFLEGIYTKMLNSEGFHALDVDNVQFNNAGSWSGQRCGHWSGAAGSSTWVQQFNASGDDPNYRQAWMSWIQTLNNWVHADRANTAVAVNFSYDFSYPSQSTQLENEADILVDEQGFTNGNSGVHRYTDAQWLAKLTDLQAYTQSGHGLQSLNQWNEAFASESSSELYWVIANTLLVNNGATWSYSCGVGQYSSLLISPMYAAAAVGTPAGGFFHDASGLYRRDFSNGMALVNSSSSATYTLSLPANTYKDLQGNVQGGSVTLGPASALVLVHV